MKISVKSLKEAIVAANQIPKINFINISMIKSRENFFKSEIPTYTSLIKTEDIIQKIVTTIISIYNCLSVFNPETYDKIPKK